MTYKFSVNEIIKTFSKFSSVSDHEINHNKTEAMGIGSIKKTQTVWSKRNLP